MVDTIELELEVETDENGELHLTKEQLGNAEPHKRYKVRLEVQPPEAQWGPRWADMTPEERAEDLRELVKTFGPGPGLSDWAVSRDSIYD
ncbi:hypothetical protein BH24DEI2_BH24DEI2_15770 [soil metagenome]